MEAISRIVDSQWFQKTIIGVIIANAVILGLQTIQGLAPGTRSLLETLDALCLAVFCVEIVLKLAIQRANYFRQGWNIFDFAVVAISLAPATGQLSVLRALRVIRLMRLVSALPSMRRVVSGMFLSIPGVASVAGVLLVMFYVAAVMATNFFQVVEPEKFGTLPATFFTLFQLMTLEGWPDVARPVMAELPYAWLFFIPFIIMTTFTTLNLLFGIIVNAMEEAKEEEAREKLAAEGVKVSDESNELRVATIEADVKVIRAMIEELHAELAKREKVGA